MSDIARSDLKALLIGICSAGMLANPKIYEELGDELESNETMHSVITELATKHANEILMEVGTFR
jgi:hypothetical protein